MAPPAIATDTSPPSKFIARNLRFPDVRESGRRKGAVKSRYRARGAPQAPAESVIAGAGSLALWLPYFRTFTVILCIERLECFGVRTPNASRAAILNTLGRYAPAYDTFPNWERGRRHLLAQDHYKVNPP